MSRRAERSKSRTTSGPAFISIRIAVGAVYHTVIRSSWRILYQRSTSKSPSSTTLVMPFVSGETMPYDVPVTHPGSAVHQKRSPSWKSSASLPVTWWAATAACTCRAPLGLPVVPLVKCSRAGSSGSVAGTWKSALASPTSASSDWVPGGRSDGSSPIRSTCSRSGNESRIGRIFRRYRGTVVTTAFALPMAIRVRTGSGPNAANSGLTTSRAFSAPSAAAYSSGTRPDSRNRRSPAVIPSDVSALATRFVAPRSSSYV